MSFLQKLGGLLGAGGGSILKDIGNVADRFITTKEEKMNFQKDMEEIVKNHEQEILKAYNQDRDSARNMQIHALEQNDRFSKRFVYYLAALWSLSGVGYIFTVTFFNVVNERTADTVLGFLMGTIVGTIINYFYGSSSPNSMEDINKK